MAPSVTILVPTLNEETAIEACLSSLLAQDFGGSLEILVIDGGSTDMTLELVAKFPGVKVLHNADRVQGAGLNRGASHATADVLVRADAHSVYATDYVRRSVETLVSNSVQAAGGPMRPTGVTPFEKAAAAAMVTPAAIGPAKFHNGEFSGSVDTIYLGAFYRTHFLERGGYRSFPSGVAEDADMYFRWRLAGDIIYLDTAIVSSYRPRPSLPTLARQFRRYGVGKAEMWWANGRLPSWRPLAPLGLVLGLMVTASIALAGVSVWPFVVVLLAWDLVILAAWASSRFASPWVPLIIAAMHLSYGWGLFSELIRSRWRREPSEG